VPFYSAEKACEAVAAIFQAGVVPSGLEFMERDALRWTMQYEPDSIVDVKDSHEAHLLIEVDGFDTEVLMRDCEKILAVLENFETDEVLFAESQSQKDQLWK